MSVQELFDFQNGALRDWLARPRAWLLQANPVWGSTETVNRIALFDTREQAEAYVEASRLPRAEEPEANKTEDGYYRSFRPDSLLWDYNPTAYGGPMVMGAIPWRSFDGVPRNPAAPSGPVPEIKGYRTRHPRYGVDYDYGQGGPYSDMDHALPAAPPAAEGGGRTGAEKAGSP